MKCKYLPKVALALTVIGALNWGFWGFCQFDLVAFLFDGPSSWMSRVIYSVIGLSALLSIKTLICCKKSECKDHCGHSEHDHCHTDQDKGGCCRK